ncbi:uncharacterized protein LOC102560219 [Alligator mississippiensis]|nr:uncharacterized protein LOC102560219 [Alligator mississippiensis]
MEPLWFRLHPRWILLYLCLVSEGRMPKCGQKGGSWSSFRDAFTCCFGQKKRKSPENSVEFSVGEWDFWDQQRIRGNDFSCLFYEDDNIQESSKVIEVAALVHRAENEGDMITDMTHTGGEGSLGKRDDAEKPQATDLDREAGDTSFNYLE